MNKRYNNLFVIFFLVVLSLFGCKGDQGPAGPAGPQGPSGVATVASQVDYFTINTGAQFIRSLGTFTAPTVPAGGTVMQTINADGSVTLAISNSLGYADCGFYSFVGMLGDLNSIKITTAAGSDPISLNLWFDTNNDTEFFSWTNDVLNIPISSDDYIDGPLSINDVYSINTGTPQFTSLHSNGKSYTLAQLIEGLASGITVTTRIAIWVGIEVNPGNKTATITSLTIN